MPASGQKFNKLYIKLNTTSFPKFLIEFLFNFPPAKAVNEDIRTHVNADAI
jgi:hypothetical protein